MLRKILMRRGTAAAWTSNNPVLSPGEFGIELDTLLIKVGDGVREWNSLPYIYESAEVKWVDITGKPTSFPSDWNTISNKPDTFPTTWAQVSGAPSVYTKVESDNRYEYKGTAYSKQEADTKYATKADTYTRSQLYTKDAADVKYATKDNTYTRSYLDGKFAEDIDGGEVV